MKSFPSDGLTLAYTEAAPDQAGEGKLPILLVHGFGSTHAVNWVNTGWSRLLAGDGHQLVMPDGRGHGASAKPYEAEAYTLDKMAGDLVALLDHLGIARAHLLGYSMGAMVSLVAASRFGARFGKVVAAGIGGNLLKPARDPAPVIDALRAEEAASITNPEGRLFRQFADQNGQDREALALCFGTVRRPFPAESLSAIENPVLVIAGETDATAGDPQPLADRIPGAEAHIVPRRDHMKAVGDKDTKAAVLAFLKG